MLAVFVLYSDLGIRKMFRCPAFSGMMTTEWSKIDKTAKNSEKPSFFRKLEFLTI